MSNHNKHINTYYYFVYIVVALKLLFTVVFLLFILLSRISLKAWRAIVCFPNQQQNLEKKKNKNIQTCFPIPFYCDINGGGAEHLEFCIWQRNECTQYPHRMFYFTSRNLENKIPTAQSGKKKYIKQSFCDGIVLVRRPRPRNNLDAYMCACECFIFSFIFLDRECVS